MAFSQNSPTGADEGGGVFEVPPLPDSNFHYDEFIAKELSTKPHRKIGIKLYWWLTAIVLMGVFVWVVV